MSSWRQFASVHSWHWGFYRAGHIVTSPTKIAGQYLRQLLKASHLEREKSDNVTRLTVLSAGSMHDSWCMLMPQCCWAREPLPPASVVRTWFTIDLGAGSPSYFQCSEVTSRRSGATKELSNTMKGISRCDTIGFSTIFRSFFYIPVWLCLGSSFGLVLHRLGYKHGQCRGRHRCCHAGLLFESPNLRLFAGWSRCLRTGWFENFELAPVIIMDAISDWSFELTFHTKEWQTSGHFLDSRPGWKQLLQSLPWQICRTALSKVLVMGRRGLGDFSGSWAQQSSRSEL